MSYEVVKTIGASKYRYQVESHRDPQTGKVRNRWRYLGKADGESAPRRRNRADETRAKITAALEQLLNRNQWNDITVHDIAGEARIAPATLYRYFKSRNDVLIACAAEVNKQLDERLALLQHIAGNVKDERDRLREWTISLLVDAPGSMVLFALWSSGLNQGEMARERNEHRRLAFVAYLQQLRVKRYLAIPADQEHGIAIALALIVQAFSYRAVVGRVPLHQDECTALADAVERLVFAAPD